MNTYQLEQVLGSDPYLQCTGYLGVYPIDALDGIPKKYPSCFVFNTDPSTENGEHWIGIFRKNREIGYYFDSYGIHPFYRKDISSLLQTCANWKFNQKAFQSLHTTTCGQYVCFFLLHAARGYTLEAVTYLLDGRSRADNDAVVFTYIRERYNQIKSLQYLSPVAL